MEERLAPRLRPVKAYDARQAVHNRFDRFAKLVCVYMCVCVCVCRLKFELKAKRCGNSATSQGAFLLSLVGVRQLLFARDVPLKTFCRVVGSLQLLALYMEQYFAGDEVVLAWWRSRTAPVGLQHPGDDHEAVIAEFLGSFLAYAIIKWVLDETFPILAVCYMGFF